MSKKNAPEGTVAVITHDGSKTVSTFVSPPAPGSGKHYNPNKNKRIKDIKTRTRILREYEERNPGIKLNLFGD